MNPPTDARAAVARLLDGYLFTAFVGLNLLQSGFTRWCPMMSLLARLGLAD